MYCAVVLDTTKVQIFKQITTPAPAFPPAPLLFQIPQRYRFSSKSQPGGAINPARVSCFRYHKGTDFQANHNVVCTLIGIMFVVLDTTKVQIFKQITTHINKQVHNPQLFQIPQRYRFSSKSQLCYQFLHLRCGCFRYHKGTDFQANHNTVISKGNNFTLFQIPQRYRFSSKSQHMLRWMYIRPGCFRYHKGTDFQANHNLYSGIPLR